ncbi:MAG TPA: hypothetical protein DCG57_14730 [Candidatus Riflebacteria bacterium]|jgi:zinc/manganese transport system substrate-binding protein|nr:hypothetical protein [Candidatus Riflebacteria bacterium]
MKHSYKLICLLLLLTFCILEPSVQAAVEIVTTTTDIKAIVEAVGGNRVRVTSLARGHEDPHFVEPRPTFMLTLRRARLLFLVGLDLEIWLQPLIEGSRNFAIQRGNPGYVDCSQVVGVKEIPMIRVDPSMGDVHPFGNPHYWLDPENGIRIAELVARRLAIEEPDKTSYFESNLNEFKTQVKSSIEVWKARIAGLKNRKVACYHNSWIYFTDFAGLEIIGYVEPRPGVPPTAREIASLVTTMKSHNSTLILRERYHSDRFANMVAERAGGKVLVLPTSVGAVDGTSSYIELIDYLVNAIAKELAAS